MNKFFISLFLILFSFESYSACLLLSIRNLSSTVSYVGGSGGYDVYDSGEYIQTVTFEVHGGANITSCDYFIALSSGGSGNVNNRQMSLGGETLDYNVYVDAAKSNILKSVGTASVSEVITGGFTALTIGGVNTHSFYWSITPEQAKQASLSNYQDANLNLSLYEGVISLIYLLADTDNITFQASVDSSVDISLVDSGNPFNLSDTSQIIDFGNLTSGATEAFDLIVRTNNGYRLNMQSINSQKMIHEDSPSVTDQIDYSIEINNIATDLSNGLSNEVATSSVISTSAGIALPVDFTVGTLNGNESSGNYSDSITVTLTAN